MASLQGGSPLFDLVFTTGTQGIAIAGAGPADEHDDLLITRDRAETWHPAHI